MSAAERRRGAVIRRNIFGQWRWVVPGLMRGPWKPTRAEAVAGALWHGFTVDEEENQ